MVCCLSARTKKTETPSWMVNAISKQLIVVPHAFFYCSLISRNRNLLFKKLQTIEAAGHLCIFLLKFYCQLNVIEFFWGAVKRYLREHCDYTYDGLRANIPKALASVRLSTIRKWEHCMIGWMEAYREGKGTKEAQIQVNIRKNTKKIRTLLAF